ncbi:MAG TPA: hypothetical protein VLD57_04420 [Blastocatellia bacterium]|nr:hypothetical protein [Blastocatellia bacterium]
MRDDYLWDGSGEPDPEIEKLENLLGRYRYQPRPVPMPVSTRRFFDRRLAIAAAIVLMALAGLWAVVLRGEGERQPVEQAISIPVEPDKPGVVESIPAPQHPETQAEKVTSELVAVKSAPRRIVKPEPDLHLPDWDSEPGVEANSVPDDTGVIGMSLPFTEAYLDLETVRHIEKAQLLLQAFKNASATGSSQVFDVEYEKEKSRELVYKNIVLRRDAEVRNNYPVEELLTSLEPVLLDIANLPVSPSKEEMQFIVERMQKTEIVTTLQVHSGLLAIRGQ